TVNTAHTRAAPAAFTFPLNSLAPEPLGQRFQGSFQPPVQLRSEWGITDVNIAVEYLGTNLQLTLQVEKTSLFKFDKTTKLIFDLQQFRASPPAQVMEFLRQ